MTNGQFFKWNIMTNVCMALSINTAATLLAGGDTFAGWVTGCCCAFTVNTVAAILIPVGRIGEWFAQGLLKARPGQALEFLARNFIINAIYVTIVSFCMALLHIGFVPGLLGIWMETYVQLHIVGFLTSLIIEKPVAYVTGHLS